ncbi:MAG TPA: type VI secretion system tube protein TssD [Candidatus Acidoferrum sp.]|jgi:type VI secretion system secreted protein Hcp|nr:type VI secretion system tube protein TssD [Candidatus Acidoferrum sp.]
MTSASVVSRTRTVVVALAVALAAILVASVAWQLANPRGAITQASAAVGVRITMKVTGTKQGVFKGDDFASSKNSTGLINVTNYQFELTVPRDPSTGLPTGKRIYKPLIATHVMGGSSPEFLAAASNNETLTSVVINFYRTDRSGKEINYYRVTLTDADVVDVRQYNGGTDVLEDDSFSFKKVEQQDFIAHTAFVDDFSVIT